MSTKNIKCPNCEYSDPKFLRIMTIYVDDSPAAVECELCGHRFTLHPPVAEGVEDEDTGRALQD
ncbi:MAG: hypothetical protein ACXABY_06860 [Candidatus Thorarchaeota archaeon]|jgi:DNA-directed RNA polymerase subunit RPC12/RpoP